MRKLMTTVAAAAAAFGLAGAAHAEGQEGKIQVKVLGTAVLATGKLKAVDYIAPALAANPAFRAPQTTLNDNAVPTLAIEYFFTPNISVETICCFTGHHVTGDGSLAGAALVDHVLVLPATVTAKFHLPGVLPLGIKPYVGAGPAWFFYISEKPGATAAALGVTEVHLANKVGVAVQGGFDMPIGKGPFGISMDVKKYFVDTRAHFFAGSTEVLTTQHKVSPWVASAGVTYRF
ncbi:MAG: OmpW family protein [Sphingomonadales bacterium]|nr:OmpW family protein [Sphingomonadales bacterium]